MYKILSKTSNDLCNYVIYNKNNLNSLIIFICLSNFNMKWGNFYYVQTERAKCSKDIKTNNIIVQVCSRVIRLWPFDLKIIRGSSPPERLQMFQQQLDSQNINLKEELWRYLVYKSFHIQSSLTLDPKIKWGHLQYKEYQYKFDICLGKSS